MRTLVILAVLGLLSCNTTEEENRTGIFHSSPATKLIEALNLDSNKARKELVDAKNSAGKYFHHEQYPEFYRASKKYAKLAQDAQDSLQLAIANNYIATYFNKTSQKDSAFFYFNRARKYSKGNRKILVSVYFNLSEIYYDIGNYTDSEKYIFTALKLSDNSKDWYSFYYGYTLLANIYAGTQDYVKSNSFLKKAFLLVEANDHSEKDYLKGTLYNNIGVNFQNINDFENSIKYFTKGISIIGAKSQTGLFYTLLDNMAYSRLKKGDTIGVWGDMKQVFVKRHQHQRNPQYVVSCLHLSEYLNKFNEDYQSIVYAKRAYNYSLRLGLINERLYSLHQLIKVDTANQGKYIEEYIRISDSVKLVERRNHNKFARIAYETDEITQQKEEAVRQKHIVTGSASALLAILGLTATVLYQRSRNRKLQFLKLQQDANTDIYRLIQDRQYEVTKARDQEKKRIARELHDGVMNRLSGTRLNLEILKQSQDPETINRCLGYINQIQDVEKELRSVSHDLSHNEHKLALDFGNMLKSLIEEQIGVMGAGLHVEFDMQTEWERVANTVKMAVYRITQEALSNCKKYAEAQNVYVTISTQNDQMILNINDDGKGFNVSSKRRGIGIKNMKARVKVLKGKFRIVSNPGIGTGISVSIPLSANWFEPEINT